MTIGTGPAVEFGFCRKTFRLEGAKLLLMKRNFRLSGQLTPWLACVLGGIMGGCLGGNAWAQQTNAGDSQKNIHTAAAPGLAEDGKKTFESVCATCHALDGRGGDRGPNIATRPDVVHMGDAELLGIITTGKPAAGMPPFAYFGDAKLQAVLAHLRALQGKERVTNLPGSAARGRTLFAGKGGCAGCHAVSGAGGFLGPDLSLYGANLSIADIRAAILEPNKNLRPRKGTVVVTTGGQNFTGLARNEDNFSLQLQTLDGTFHFFQKARLEHVDYLPSSIMPADYGTKLSAPEVDDLISYLVSVARAKAPHSPLAHEEWDDE